MVLPVRYQAIKLIKGIRTASKFSGGVEVGQSGGGKEHMPTLSRQRLMISGEMCEFVRDMIISLLFALRSKLFGMVSGISDSFGFKFPEIPT